MKQNISIVVAFAMIGLLFGIMPQAYSQSEPEEENLRIHWGGVASSKLYISDESVLFTIYSLDRDVTFNGLTAFVWSDSDPEGHTIQMSYTAWNNPRGLIQFSDDFTSSDRKLKVKSGDTIFVKYNDFVDSIMIHEYVSPLKQQEFGTAPDQIECRNGYLNMQIPDGPGVCVKPSSISKLIEKDWVLMPGKIFKG